MMKKNLFLCLAIALVCFYYQGVLHAATVEVSMVDFKFQPNPVNINVGDSIVWKNNAIATPHTSTSGTGCQKDGKWDTKTINPGQSSQPVVFNSAGSFPYYCIFHCLLGMTGTVKVSGGTSTTSVPGSSTTTTAINTTTSTVPAGECMVMSVKSTVLPLQSGLLLPRLRRIVITGMNSNWDRTSVVSIEDITFIIPLRVNLTKITALIIIPSQMSGFMSGEKNVTVETGAEFCAGTVDIQ